MAERRRPSRRTGPGGTGWVLAALGVMLAAGTWLWFDANFERQLRELPAGESEAARRNPFLAAERFLAGLGVAADSSTDLSLLRTPPGPRDMLVIDGLPPLNAERRARLRAWLEAGGRLLAEAIRLDEAASGSDDFLAELGAMLRFDEAADGDADVVADVQIAGYPEPLQVAFAAPWYLEDAAGMAVGDAGADGRARLLEYAVGDGIVYVVSDTLWLGNGAIGRHDHALLLARLAADRDHVWLLHDVSVPHLAVLLWRAAPAAVLSAALLLAAVLWHIGGRLGPLLPAPAAGRRDLLEHLEAAGDFLWQRGRGAVLVSRTRRRIERDWLRRHPPLRKLDQPGRARRISEQSHLPVSEVQAALYGPLPDLAALPRITAALQRLARR
ncbi:DUF4350 domain-containing protein [Thiohalocapsa sp. ML1]|uniref:DUF4350 domain-containing protein n=1 Tax=Thiohalocapsa sp. ML1 TaxID=1431688 RepID=UPI000ABA316D|nr:DUF4350 domain-containing protein [Thiohalocapsa sp. ML1]